MSIPVVLLLLSIFYSSKLFVIILLLVAFTSLGLLRGYIATIFSSTAVVDKEYQDLELGLVVEKVMISDKTSYFIGRLLNDSRYILDNFEAGTSDIGKGLYSTNKVTELNKLRLYFDRYKFSFSSGDKVLLRADIYPFYNKLTRYGFDFTSSQLFLGVGGLASVIDVLKLSPSNKISSKMINFFEGLRERISDRFDELLSAESRGIATTLITGKREISSELYRNWQVSGTSHLLAISGLHIGFVAMFVYIVLLKASLLIFREKYSTTIKYIAIFSSLFSISCYLLISGISTSALRAYIMVVTIFIAMMLSRPVISLYNVGLAALIITLINPYLITTPSFQFSFFAVIAIVSSFHKVNYVVVKERIINFFIFQKLKRYFSLAFATTALAGLAVIPLTIYYLGYVATYGILANIIIVPIITIFVIPLLFLSLLLQNIIGDKLILIAGYFIEIANKLNYFISNLAYSEIKFINYPYIDILIFVSGGLIFCIHRSKLRYFGLVLIFSFYIKIFIFNIPPKIVIFGGGKSVLVGSSQGYYINKKLFRGSNFERDVIYQSLAIDKDEIELLSSFKSDDTHALSCYTNYCLYKVNALEIVIIDKQKTSKQSSSNLSYLETLGTKCDRLSLLIITHDVSNNESIEAIEKCLAQQTNNKSQVIDLRAIEYKDLLTTYITINGQKIVISDSG